MEPFCKAEKIFAHKLQEAADDGICASAARIHISRHEHVYNCGQSDGNVYLIESGQVKTLTYTRNGKQCILSIHGPDNVFGESSVLLSARTETAQTMQATTLIRIPVARIMNAPDPSLRNALVNHMAARLLQQQEAIANLVTMDSEHRLAALLVTLGNKFGKQRDTTILVRERFTQEELAEMVGTTRSRIGYFLKRFTLAGALHRTEESYLCIHVPELTDYLDSAKLVER